MNKLVLNFALLAALSAGLSAHAQKKKEVINDSNTPLHLLQPDYQVGYGIVSAEDIKKDMDRVLRYLESNTPTRVVDKRNGKVITDYANMDTNAQLERGAFRLASYEWGVTYSAMLAAAEATGDEAYKKYVYDRFKFLSEVAPYFKKVYEKYGTTDAQMLQILTPHALDDAGAVCAAMMKAQMKDKSLKLQDMIDNYFHFIMYKEHRLADGTFARNRPYHNTLWLDDMFMGIPSVALMGRYASDHNDKYYQEAVRQVLQFAERMFVPEKGLFRHGWVEGMKDHPAFHWGRANGWAILTMCEVLDVLPADYPGRDKIISLLQAHVRGLAACQSKDGFWHQLLDRNDSYLESSATALYVYCIAHAINKGWIDAMAYGPVVQLGWHAVSSAINAQGQVEMTCVGTGMGYDPAFYYYRPVNVYAAHGYGPVIWAGAEMLNLLKHQHPRMNDSAVHFYPTEQQTKEPIFFYSEPGNPREFVAGVSRINEKSPVAFLIGDSTVKCGAGNGEDNKWGWGSYLQNYFDTTRISIENCALGGRSSRTYFTEGLWNRVLPAIKPGDYVLIDFGHNDGGPMNTGRARASLPGTGDDSKKVVMEKDGSTEKVYSFGHYIRMYIRQAKAKGAKVIVMSHTPGNRWTDNHMNRCDKTYGKWSKEVAEQEGVSFIDLNDLTANKFEAIGKEKTAAYYADSVHNTQEGAVLNAESVVEGIRSLQNCDLKDYLK
jgi:hypothetical protein